MLHGTISIRSIRSLVWICLLCAASTTHAATFAVTSTADSGVGSLRQAILDANLAGIGPHIIDVQTSGTVTLLSPLPTIATNVTVNGVGTANLDVTGSSTSVGAGQSVVLDTPGAASVLDVGGDGALEKTGIGTLTLNGTSSYAGGTTVSGGTLEGDTSSLQGAVTNNANVTFNQAGSGTYAGNMSGTGSLTKAGAGTLVLSGTNTYAGGTTVSDGALSGDTTSLQGNITNNADVIFNQTTTGTYAGSIGGTGTVSKQGAGSLTFSGNHTYSGLTTVAAGTLVVNGSISGALTANTGSTLKGSGALGNTTVAGTIAPGNSIGTLTVNGTYTQSAGSTYEVELNNAGTVAGVNNDLINVTGAPGTAVINGGTVDVLAAAGDYTPGTLYTILQSSGGVSGTYDSLTDNLALRDFALIYNANTIQLQVLRASTGLSTSAVTINQLRLAEALDDVASITSGDLGDAIDQLTMLPAANQPNALDQMTGQVYGTLATLGLQRTALIHQLLHRRLRGELGPPVTGRRPVMASNPAADRESSVALVSHSCAERDCRPHCVPTCSPWSGWVLGYGLGGDASTDRNAAGADFSLGGTLFGANRWLGNSALVGFYGTYAHSNVTLGNPNQDADVDTVQLGGFLRHRVSRGYWLLSGGAGYDDYETRRVISFGGIDRVAEGDNSGQQAIVALERGWVHCWNDVQVIPFAGLRYNYLHQNEFNETGAQALSLGMDETNTHSLRSELGINLMRQLQRHGKGRATGRLHALWMHEFLDPIVTVTSSMGGLATFNTRGLDLGRDWAVLGAGGDYCVSPHTTLFCNYDLQLNSHQAFHVGSGGIQVNW